MRVMIPVRKLVVVAMVAMTVMLTGCTSSTAPAVTRAANAAKAAAVAAEKAEAAAKAAEAAAEKAEAAVVAAEMSSATACTASQLRLGFFGSGGGNPGQAVTAIRVTDTSSLPCSLRGYPAVTFLSKAGAVMRVTVGRTPTSVFYGAVTTVLLPPRKAASAGFLVTSSAFPAEGTACPAASIRVRLPNMTQTFKVTAAAWLCRLSADISPVVKGAVLASAL
jgi:hypothetical protein